MTMFVSQESIASAAYYSSNLMCCGVFCFLFSSAFHFIALSGSESLRRQGLISDRDTANAESNADTEVIFTCLFIVQLKG